MPDTYDYLDIEELESLGFSLVVFTAHDVCYVQVLYRLEFGASGHTDALAVPLSGPGFEVEVEDFMVPRRDEKDILGSTQDKLDELRDRLGVKLAAKRMHNNGEIRVQLRRPTEEDNTAGGSVLTVLPPGAKGGFQEAHFHPDSKEWYKVQEGAVDLYCRKPFSGEVQHIDLSLYSFRDGYTIQENVPHTVYVHDGAIFLARRIGGTGKRIAYPSLDSFVSKRYGSAYQR